MRILMTNHSLKDAGGTEKWTHTLACEFMRRGHEVDVFTFMKGITSEHLEKDGAKIVEDPQDDYDVMFSNHGTCLGFLTTRLSCPKIHTSHGPSHQLEIPSKGADTYVAVSWEVRARHAALGFYQELIGNGVDLLEFRPSEMLSGGHYDVPLSVTPQRSRVLSMCKDVNATDMVRFACDQAGLDFDYVHYTDAIVWDIASKMRTCDIVVGCGRTAIEGLACGRQVLVFDWRDPKAGSTADGWVTEGNVEDLAQSNFSARYNNHHWGVSEVVSALKDVPTKTGWQREWAKLNADVVSQADQYLRLVEKARKKSPIRLHNPDLTAEYEEVA